VVVQRGDIWWADLPIPRRSEPGYRRPVLIVQASFLNESEINTVLVSVVTSNLRLSELPGNVLLTTRATGLETDSVANLTQLVTLDRSFLVEQVGHLEEREQKKVDAGLRLILELGSPNE